MEASVGERGREVGAGWNMMPEKTTRWAREEESKQENPEWKLELVGRGGNKFTIPA